MKSKQKAWRLMPKTNAGSVELILGTKDKPKYKKLHYWKYFLTNNFVVYEFQTLLSFKKSNSQRVTKI